MRLTSIEFSFDPCNICRDVPRGVGYPADARSVGDSHPSCYVSLYDENMRVGFMTNALTARNETLSRNLALPIRATKYHRWLVKKSKGHTSLLKRDPSDFDCHISANTKLVFFTTV